MYKSPANRRRVEFLKKLIIRGGTGILILLIILCIILFVSNIKLSRRVGELEEKLKETEGEYAYEASGVYSIEDIDIYDNADDEENHHVDETEDIKKVYLTFDDGPSPNTEKILDILDEYDIKATFFVIGDDKEKYADVYKRIADSGHTLGMHSYSHRYDEVYASEDAFKEDLRTLQEYLYETTGVWSRVYRFPGGSSNTVSKIPITELISYLNDEGIAYFDWNIASGDAIEGTLSAEKITSNCLGSIDKYDTCVILMHDAADRRTTVEALPDIIEGIKRRGDCVLLPITDETSPIQHVTVNN